ncbi:hypothetical protein ACVINZ_000948 [Mesorhizobium jarvisii]
MSNIRTEQIVARINNEALRQAAAACLDVADRYRARCATIQKDVTLTDIGRNKAIKDEAGKTLTGLKAAYQPIAKALYDAKQARAAISIPAPDPSNIAAALERQEIRAMVRAIDGDSARYAFLTGVKDERIADAVLSAPGCLSGVSDEHFGQLRDLVVERRFGAQVAEIREAEETARAAEAAMLVATNDVKAITGLDDRSFDNLHKASVLTPWLVKSGDRVLKVIPGNTSYPPASADEIAIGKYYANQAEYLADNPGVKEFSLAAAA